MLIRNHRKQTLKLRLIILSITSLIFLTSFVLNITLSQPLYDYNLNVVPILQSNPSLGSSAFMTFMNIISLVFDPMICAGYIFIIYLVSYRKLQIIAFLIWFFVLSWFLGIMKMAIHQARPFWVPGSQVKMQSWTCYTDYGSPSGHAMLAIVLLEFLLRFYARVHLCIHKYIGLFYLLIFVIQLLVMFSRVMLGMHSFNQVLFGLTIGLFSFIPYYLFIQNFIMRLVLKVFANQRSMKTNIVLLLSVIVFFGISLLTALLPDYHTQQYYIVVKNTSGCQHVKQYSSFQYACLIGTSIISAGFGVILGFSYMKKPYNLAKVLSYTRISIKFVAKLLITIVVGLIPLVIFLNPLWHDIKSSIVGNALITWACDNLAFFLAIFLILLLSPEINEKLGLEQYKHPSSYDEYKKFEVINMLNTQNSQYIVPKHRQTELTEPKISNFGTK